MLFSTSKVLSIISILAAGASAHRTELSTRHRKPLPKSTGSKETYPEVTIKNGTVQGIYNENFNQDFFLGIPYATPPVGELRFNRPTPAKKFDGTFKAHAYSDICYGVGTDQDGLTMSEDCLSINVVRPHNVKEGDNVPVLFWIYGGGFYEGSSADTSYNLSYIVQRSAEMGNPVVGVSINYRQHFLGFPSGLKFQESRLLNLGLWDQRQALRWAQENIKKFGGDPDKVTVWGESAGASSIGMHLVAFGGEDHENLFRAAIMESGGPTANSYPTPSSQQSTFLEISTAIGCDYAENQIDCFRAVNISTLYNAILDVVYTQPTIDSDLIPTYPSELLKSGKFKKVPILSGVNTDEGVFVELSYNTDEAIIETIIDLYMDPPREFIVRDIAALYSDDPAEGCPYNTGDTPALAGGAVTKKAYSMFGDLNIIAGNRLALQSFSKYVTAYSYRFDHLPWYAVKMDGIEHEVEIPYVFGAHLPYAGDSTPEPDNTLFPLGTSPEELALNKLMMSQWISFAVHLDPNYHQINDIPHWPDYSEVKNFVFRNTTEGGYGVESDYYRSKAIEVINEVAMEFSR